MPINMPKNPKLNLNSQTNGKSPNINLESLVAVPAVIQKMNQPPILNYCGRYNLESKG
jgi:hypothetical protein